MSKPKDMKRLVIYYEIIMALMALVAVYISIMDFAGRISLEEPSFYYYIDLSILIVFAVDYITRFVAAKDRKRFFFQNIFDLLAIIPYSSIFRAFRLAKLVQLMRLIKVFKIVRILIFLRRFIDRAGRFLNTTGFIYAIYSTITIMLLGSVGIYYFESGKTVDSFGDALWWSFVTATTVGYGDISPITVEGRIIAAIVMLSGIGFIGTLTGTITTFFINMKSITPTVEKQQKDIDIRDLNQQEYDDVLRFIEFIKSKR